jgi:hypothetical protein
VSPDHDRFPDYDNGLRLSMQRETELFLQAIVREVGASSTSSTDATRS